MFKNTKMILWVAVTCIVLAGTIYFFNNIRIPRMKASLEQDIRQKVDVAAMPKRRVAVVVDKQGIAKYTQLTEEVLNGKIQVMDVPVDFTVESAAVDVDQIKGKVTKEDLRCGEQVSLDSLSTEEKWFGDFERLKEFEVKSIVADEVKPGNIVDLIVDYRNGTYDVIVPKTKVRKIVKTGTAENTTAAADGKYTLIFALDETMFRDVQLASKLGDLVTRLYIDDSQKASPKTFNYSVAAQKIPYIKGEGSNAPKVSAPAGISSNTAANPPVQSQTSDQPGKINLVR